MATLLLSDRAAASAPGNRTKHRRRRDSGVNLCGLLERGFIVVRYSFEHEQTETLRLIRRSSGTPMSFAGACLVRMVEKSDHVVVVTTDNDFRTYRKNGRQVIPLIIPT